MNTSSSRSIAHNSFTVRRAKAITAWCVAFLPDVCGRRTLSNRDDAGAGERRLVEDALEDLVATPQNATYIELDGRYADSVPEFVDIALEFSGIITERPSSHERREVLPTGTVTFLLTDIVGSTELWDRAPAQMAIALGRHDELITQAVEGHFGIVVKSKGEGDSSLSVFSRATDAAAAAVAIQDAVTSEPWPQGCAISVRAGVHTGEAEIRDGDYYGPAVNRAARLRALAGAEQILMSAATASLIADQVPDGCTVTRIGEHALKGLRRPEQIHELRRE